MTTTPTLNYPRHPARDWSKIDAACRLPSDDRLRDFAKRIDAQHAGKPSTVFLAPDYRLRGLWCDRHFARVMQIGMPLILDPRGNRRRAFALHDGTTIDVVGRTPKKGAIYPDLTRRVDANHRVGALVLICFNGFEHEPEVVGWMAEYEFMQMAARVTLKNTQGDGRAVEDYLLGWRHLRSISELCKRHAPSHPLAETEDRPFYWASTESVAANNPVQITAAVTQTTMFETGRYIPRTER